MRFFLCVLVVISCSVSKPTKEVIQARIVKKFASQAGTYALAFKNLQTGETWGINEREVFHAASTMKVAVMYDAYRQAASGAFSLQDSVVLKNEFKSIVDSSSFSLHVADDSEPELYRHLGEKESVYTLIYQMIIASSNLATNLMIEKVGANHVMNTLRDIGIHDMRVLRGVEDSKAFEKGLNNTTTAHDLLLLFDAIENSRGVRAEASQQMKAILLDQKFNEIIPARLPSSVKVAHKTGSITGVQHDGGIVYLPDGKKYMVVLLSKEIKHVEASVNMMAEVSRMLYDYVVSQ